MKRQLPATKSSETTKPKKAFIQTNTLFSYFESNNKPKAEVKPTVTNSILNYFKSENVESKPVVKSEPLTEKKSQSPLNESFKPQKKASQSNLSNLMKIEPVVKVRDAERECEASQIGANAEAKTNTRKCPFYKRVEGTQICVDAFSYGDIEACNAYFLSHYHYDHFIGLKKDFKNQLFCSQVTANLVVKNIKVDKKYINVLEYNKFLNVYDDGSVQVALIDANQ